MAALIVRRRIVATLVGLVAVPLVACTTTQTGGYDGPVYDSVEAIASMSTAAVVGRFSTFKNVEGIRLGTFQVARSTSASPGTLTIDMTGENGNQDPHTETLAKIKTGTTYLIFVRKVAKASRSDLQSYGDVYRIEGGANGVFTITGGTAAPLGPGVPMSTASPGPSGAHAYSVEELMPLEANG